MENRQRICGCSSASYGYYGDALGSLRCVGRKCSDAHVTVPNATVPLINTATSELRAKRLAVRSIRFSAISSRGQN